MNEEINAGSLRISLEADDSLLLQQVQQTAKKVAQEIGQSLNQSFAKSNQAQQQKLQNAKQITEEEEQQLLLLHAQLKAEQASAKIGEIEKRIAVEKQQAQVDLLSYQVKLNQAKVEDLSKAREQLQVLKGQMDIQKKIAGYQKEMQQMGLKSQSSLVLQGGFDQELQKAEKLRMQTEKARAELEKRNQPLRGMERFRSEIAEGMANKIGSSLISIPGKLLGGFIDLAGNVGGAFLSALTDAFGAATGFLKNQISQSLEAFKTYEAIEVRVNIATQGQGDTAMDFLQKLSDKYRVDFQVAADSYAGLAASMMAAGKSMQEINFIYESLTVASRSLGLSNEDLSGVFKATEQIFSKQKVTAEELRQQLGDRLPGAVSIMAKALGVTTAELNDLMKEGKLTSDTMFDLARGLKDQYGSQVAQALDTTSAAQARLNNEIFKLQRDFGEAINPINVAAMEVAGDILEDISRDVFNNLNDRALEFQQYLEDNPEIVQQIADELNLLLNGGLNFVADKAGELLQYLEENPAAISQAIDQASQFAQSIGEVTGNVLELANHLDDVAKTMGTIWEWSSRIAPELLKAMPFLGQFITAAEAAGFVVGAANDRLTGGESDEASVGSINYRTGTYPNQHYGAPRDGGSRIHAGVDFDVDEAANEAIRAILGGTVTKIGNDLGGYGNYIDIYNSRRGVVERLAEMATVNVQVGQVIAPGQQIGSGSSTGVLHYEIRNDLNAQNQGGYGVSGTVDPIAYLRGQGFDISTMGGETRIGSPRANNSGFRPNRPTSPSSSAVNIAALAQAIAGKESGNGQDVYNEDSGASGLYQVMPENVGPWSREILGREVSYQEFMANPELQKRIAEGKIRQYYEQAINQANGDQDVAVRMVASAWYSGQMGLYDNPSPQYSNGNRYPSIREYTTDILGRYQRLSSNGSLTPDPGTSGRANLNRPSEEELKKQEEERIRELRALQDETKQAQREQQNQARDYARQQRDLNLGTLEAGYPNNELVQSTVDYLQGVNQINDRYSDQIVEYNRSIEDLREKVQQLRAEPLESESNRAARNQAIQENEILIRQLEEQRNQLEQTRKTELGNLNTRSVAELRAAEEQAEKERQQYRLEMQAQKLADQDRLAIANAPNDYERQLLGNDASSRATEAQISLQVGELNQELQTLQQTKQQLEEAFNSLPEATRQSLQEVFQLQIQGLDKAASHLQEQIQDIEAVADTDLAINLLERRNILRERQRQQDAALSDTHNQLFDLRANQVERESGVWVANDYRKQAATAQILAESSSRMEQYRSAGTLTPELEAAEMEKTQLQIAELEQQFVSLGETIDGVLQGSFKQFFMDLVTGSQDAGEAFLNMIQSIAASLAELAFNQIFVDLLGSGGLIQTPGAASPAEGGLSGIVGIAGSILGAMGGGGGIPAFAQGGVLTKPTLGMIAEAGYAEAVVPLPNGKVPIEVRGNKGLGGSVTSNLTVNVSSSGAVSKVSGSNVNAMSRELEAAVLGVIQKHSRNGGMLSR